MAGDQQAATIGQACFSPGMLKSTYGTGCFAMLVTGAAVASRHRLLTTLAWQLDGRRTYALEGAIFNAGSTVQWLRDGLGIIASAAEATIEDFFTLVLNDHVCLLILFSPNQHVELSMQCQRGLSHRHCRGKGRFNFSPQCVFLSSSLNKSFKQ
jgi:hypothetical protein